MSDVLCPKPDCGGFVPCNKKCAWLVGDRCAVAWVGEWARANLEEVERQELLALSRARCSGGEEA